MHPRINHVLPAVLLSMTTCGPIVTPDASQMEAVQRTARLQELHRLTTMQELARESDQLHRFVQELTRGFEIHDGAMISRWVVESARAASLDPFLVAAVITTESYFNPNVISYAGAVGLMQVLPYVGADVARRHGIVWENWQTLKDPRRNIQIGTLYLSELIDMFDGDIRLALAAYNMGPTLLNSRLRRGWVPNGPYVRKVMGRYAHLTQLAAHERHLIELAGGAMDINVLPL